MGWFGDFEWDLFDGDGDGGALSEWLWGDAAEVQEAWDNDESFEDHWSDSAGGQISDALFGWMGFGSVSETADDWGLQADDDGGIDWSGWSWSEWGSDMLSLWGDSDSGGDDEASVLDVADLELSDTVDDLWSDDSEGLSFDLTDFVGADSFSLDDFLADSGATITISW
jgi:hypothetical protein